MKTNKQYIKSFLLILALMFFLLVYDGNQSSLESFVIAFLLSVGLTVISYFLRKGQQSYIKNFVVILIFSFFMELWIIKNVILEAAIQATIISVVVIAVQYMFGCINGSCSIKGNPE